MTENEPQKQQASNGSAVKKPIRRSLLIVACGLFLFLCALLGILVYSVFSSSLHSRYNSKLDDVITYVESNIDADDMAQCLETGQPSEKYNELQKFLNGLIDNFELEYLYIVIPGEDVMINAISATSAEEFAAGETDMPILEESDAYDRETLQRFRSYWDTEGINYFEESSEYGVYYTGIKALRDSSGKTIALICVDLSIDSLYKSIQNLFVGGFLLVVVLFGMFGSIVLIWLRKNVTDPLLSLEESARQFADQNHDVGEEGSKRYKAPAINTENEIQSLSEAIEKMANDMQDKAEETMAAKMLAQKAEEEKLRLEEEAKSAARIAELSGSMASLLTNMPAMTFSKNVETRQYLACNQQFAEFAHKDKPEDIVGLTDVELFGEETAARIAEDDKQAISMDEPFVFFEDISDDDGNPRQFQTTKLKFTDAQGRMCLLGMRADVTEMMSVKNEVARAHEISQMYSRIAALSGEFLCVYSLDPVTGAYVEYGDEADFVGLGFSREGHDFFTQFKQETEWRIYASDRNMVLTELTEENVLRDIERNGLFVLKFRLMLDGVPTYVSLQAAKVEDELGSQIIVGLANIDNQVKREKEYEHKLSEAHVKAHIDALTGVKNKRAYVDYEDELDQQIEGEGPVEFAIVVCDVNNLKLVNDTKGHQAGDSAIKQACDIVCNVFSHSPVFRVGGDEFAVIARGRDYESIDDLVLQIAQINKENAASGEIVIACGMARFEGDSSVASVFKRADRLMYENKKSLKAM